MMLACCGASTDDEEIVPRRLSPPENVTVQAASPGTMEFRWDAAPGATGYNCRLLKGMTLLKEQATSATTILFDGLEPETLYRFAVKSFCDGSESDFSAYVEGKTGKAAPSGTDYPDAIGTPDQVLAAMAISDTDDKAHAFPGASGGGRWTTGGRSGKVIHVTNLNDSGEGSLRAAINEKGPRTVVFDIAGIIELKSSLTIKNGDITIAGQTAPGDGICLKGQNFRINASNVIIRYIRCRMGDASSVEDDAMNCYCNGNPPLRNIVIDHCSMSWSTDECGSFYGAEDFTLQYCILSESLRTSVHGKGTHGYGGIWGGKNASFHHNLLAHHDSRNPRFDHDYVATLKGPVHFYNNVIYNWGGNSGYGGESGPGQSPRQINVVNNWYKPGPASSNRSRIVNPTTKCSNCNKGDQYDVVPGLFYVSGNHMDGSDEVTADNWKGVHPDDKTLIDKVRSTSYMGEVPPEMQTAGEAWSTVLSKAGASRRRDRVDARIVSETRDGTYTYTGSKGKTKGIIDTQDDVGGWPVYSATPEELARMTDSDSDGIPDWYESLLGLDMGDPSDAAKFTIDSKAARYTNLELYMHYLIKDTQ